MIDDHLFEAMKRLREWAQHRSYVRRLWVFGSRLKGIQRDDSDLDVAMEIDPLGNDETVDVAWVCHRQEWEADMTQLVSYEVQLHAYDIANRASPIVGYVGCCAALVYERTP
jgi:Predicted nucleotidyltransferases